VNDEPTEVPMEIAMSDDAGFSGCISELMLRAGIPSIRFAWPQEALEVTRDCMPDVVVFRMPGSHLTSGWSYYEKVLSASALALAEHGVGTPATSPSTDQLPLSDVQIAQISAQLDSGRRRWIAPPETCGT
jgi:hypothetical protein